MNPNGNRRLAKFLDYGERQTFVCLLGLPISVFFCLAWWHDVLDTLRGSEPMIYR